MLRNMKMRTIFFGIIIPLLIWLFASFFVGILIGISYLIIPSHIEIDAIMTLGFSSILAIIALVPYYIYYKKKYNIVDGKIDKKVLYYLIPISFGACLSMNVLLNMFEFVQNDKLALEVSEAIKNANPIVAIIVVSVIAPFIEELIYRGFIYKSLEKSFGFVVGMIFSSLMFGIVHFNITQGLYAFVIGLLLAYIYYKYNSIIYTYFMHLLMNFFTLFIVGPLFLDVYSKRAYYLIFVGVAMTLIGIMRLRVLERSKE